jgi:formylglycine-generating enzyme required for sulfatase activity
MSERWRAQVWVVGVVLGVCVGGCGEDEAPLPPCPSDELITVNAPALGLSFKMDKYEAARSSASAASEGSGASRACAIAGVKPWHSATFAEAKAACEASGKRLCTQDEWRAVCGNTSNNHLYPYGNDYEAGRCNDSDPSGGSKPAGASAQCKTLLNAFDMSGNVREWTSDGRLMGGSFASSRLDTTCASAIAPPGGAGSYNPGTGDGFRCCQ